MTSDSTKRSKTTYSAKVVIKTQVEGFHSFRHAPEEVAFLKNEHRHIFDVTAILPETKDRSLEFFIVKRALDDLCRDIFKEDLSCEGYAKEVADKLLSTYKLPNCEVRVFEDNENGISLTATIQPKEEL